MAQMTKEEVMAKLASLPIGQLMLVSSRRVEDETKLQLEFAEVVRKPVIQTVGLFNASDERFTNANVAQRAWQTVTKVDFKKQTGIDLESYVHGEEVVKRGGVEKTLQIAYIGLTGIKVQGMDLHLQIQETQEPTAWQAANVETSAKQAPRKNAPTQYLLKDGKPIFRNVTIVAVDAKAQPNHKFIEHDEVSMVIPSVFNVIEDDEEPIMVDGAEADTAKA